MAGEEAVWVRSNLSSPFVYKISAATGRIVGDLSVGGADAIVAAGWDVWVADSTHDVVVRVDPGSVTQSGLLTGSFDHPAGVAVGQGALWVLSSRTCSLTRVEPGTGTAAEQLALNLFRATQVVAGDEGVWVTTGGLGVGCNTG